MQNKLLENLNKEQKDAVTHSEGPLLIVAGAGTGKTSVITRRIAYLIEQQKAKPEEILSLTFTDKAAGEMQERVDLLLPLGYYNMWISTFHSFCERVLKAHALDIGLPNDFELLDDTKQWVLVYNNFEKFDLDYYKPLGNPSKFISALLSHFSKCKDEVITPSEYLEYAENLKLQTDSPEKTKKGRGKREDKKKLEMISKKEEILDDTEISRIQELANAYHVYQKLLLENNFLDFGDLINCCLELFKKRPHILKQYQTQFKYLMVDEFQDTNFAQYQLVKMLAGDRQNIAVVGDDDQSIYKFRGASVSNILKFKNDFPSLNQITLVENYRSGKEILDLAYKLIQQNNPDRLEIKLNINKQLKSNTSELGFVEVIEAPDLASELNSVVNRIKKLKTESNSWNDFAILLRSNGAAEELLPVLTAAQIPHTFLANSGLYKKPIILDLLAYMSLLNNVHDSFSLYRVLNIPLFRLQVQEIASLLEFSKKKTLSLYESLEQVRTTSEIGKEAKEKIELLLKSLQNHHRIAQEKSASEVTVELIKDLKFAEILNEETWENSEKRELIEQFYKKIESFEQIHKNKSLNNFLFQLELEQEAGDDGKINFNPDSGPESLKVLTVHASKGLEFENVFVINLVDKRFPSIGKKDPIEIPKALIKDILPEGDFHLQEERRLFYVAITRAKKNLFLTWAKDYGGKTAKKPSQFLIETGLIPSEKINKATGKVVFERTPQDFTNSQPVFHQLPDRFSYSQLIDFETCPLKFKYQYYLKLPVRGSHYLSFGNTIHKVFEDYLKTFKEASNFLQADLFGQSKAKIGLPKFETLEKLYEKNWIDEWYQKKEDRVAYKKQGEKMLKLFYDYSLKNTPKPKYLEQSFILFLGKYKLVGRIDRADESPSGLIIYDYKTGKRPKTKQHKDIGQLGIYQMAANEYLKENVAALKYWYMQTEDEPVDEDLFTNQEIVELKERLMGLMDKVVETIKYDKFKEAHDMAPEHECSFLELE